MTTGHDERQQGECAHEHAVTFERWKGGGIFDEHCLDCDATRIATFDTPWRPAASLPVREPGHEQR